MMEVSHATTVAVSTGHKIAKAVVPNHQPEIKMNRAERRRALAKLGLLSQRKRARYGLPERHQ